MTTMQQFEEMRQKLARQDWEKFWQKLRADLDEAIRDGRIRPTENYYTGNSGRALGPNDTRTR